MNTKTMATSRRRRARRSGQEILDAAVVRARRLGNRAAEAIRARPRSATVAAGLVTVGLLAGLLDSGNGDDIPAQRVAVITLPDLATESVADQGDAEVPAGGIPPVAPQGASDQPDPVDIDDWVLVEIRPGQTLERVFRDLDLSPQLLHEVVNASDQTRQLASIRPGDTFAFDIDPEDGFRALRAELDEDAWLYIERHDENISTRTEPRALDRRIVEASGTISSSLYRDATEAGLSDDMIMRLANIFGWDIDFALDIRAGDRFALIYEEIWRDGEHLRDGPILAARFVNRGEAFDAIRYDAGNGPDYFAPDGRPMRKAFLRAPLNFTRVTSNFNPRRFHPVTRRVQPHNGTDYGAQVGTPVWSAGDGRVIESAYNSINGHYVFIRHGNNIVTRYLHLSRREVERGDRVRQRQTIGRVGATGRATGPHLHYEFLVNGAHRNPRKVDLPPADPLPAEHMDDFSRTGERYLARLDSIDQPRRLLASSDEGCERAGGSC
ncbi:MAG: OapA family protein [Wenzhouxiangella sp.]